MVAFMTEKRDKVTVDDIIGLIHTDEITNSVELKKDLYRDNQNKRFKHMRNRLGMQFICYDDKEILMGTFADADGISYIVKLLNNLHEQLEPIQKICEKYNIKLKDLPATLEEYIANDNDGYAGYSKCDGCKYDFEVDEK